MPRNPFQAHLSAKDPDGFALGFDFARFWVTYLAHEGEPEAIRQAIADSDGGADWPIAGRIPWTPQGEGFALGVYGITQTQRHP